MLEKIKARIAEIEKAINELLAQYNTLTGHLNEAKHLLNLASNLAAENAQESCEAHTLQAVDKIVDECANEVVNNENIAS